MNPKLGDVAFKIGGKTYTFRLGVNGLCLVEAEADASATDVIQRIMTKPRLTDIRLLFWAGLQEHHPEIDKNGAGDLVQLLNQGKKKPVEIILEAMKLASPDVDDALDGEAATGAADPPLTAAGAGTGTASS